MNGLKVCFLVDSHSLTGYGMREFQSLGMQIQPFGFLSVELIADNGAVQSESMGGMHPELMGASGAGIKGDAGMIVLAAAPFAYSSSRSNVLLQVDFGYRKSPP